MARKSGKHLRVTYGTAVSTLLGFISSVHRNLHHWWSNQQLQYAEAETLPLGHQFMSRISDAELTSHSDNVRPLVCIPYRGQGHFQGYVFPSRSYESS